MSSFFYAEPFHAQRTESSHGKSSFVASPQMNVTHPGEPVTRGGRGGRGGRDQRQTSGFWLATGVSRIRSR
jgi:hypothetical protein